LRRKHQSIGLAGRQHNLEAVHKPPGCRPVLPFKLASGQLGCVRPESDGVVAGLRN